MSLDVDARIERSGFVLDVRLDVEDGETLAVIGPNGAGKSTVIEAIAGLAELDSGSIRIDGDVADHGGGGQFTPPHARPVGVLFQSFVLFPHLSAEDNVAFGVRARRQVSRSQARESARDWLERFEVESCAQRRPDALSGGQAQRVALARALAPAPRVLLLDEPMAAIDAGARPAIRRELRQHLDAFGGMALVVTHDPVDVATLADRAAVLENGRITQSGTMEQLRRRPRSEYVAELIGVNLLSGTADGTSIALDGGGAIVAAEARRGRVLAVVHPHAVALHAARPEGTPRNVWEGTIAAIESAGDRVGDRVRVRVDAVPGIVAEVTPGAVADLDLMAGRRVWMSVKATEIEVFDA